MNDFKPKMLLFRVFLAKISLEWNPANRKENLYFVNKVTNIDILNLTINSTSTDIGI